MTLPTYSRLVGRVRGVLIAALLLWSATMAHAKTYYVSQSAGDDKWGGEAAASDGKTGPWKTLARASKET